MYIIIIPWLFAENFSGMAFFPFIILKRKNDVKNKILINHEKIHLQQQKELLILPFYIFYGIEYLCRVFQYKFNLHLAYQNISFEREAYYYQDDLNYINTRKLYNFKQFL